MIVVDTSALVAVVAKEFQGAACRDVLDKAEIVAISAGTLAEALIVAVRHQGEDLMNRLLNELPLEIVPVGEAEARRVAVAYSIWGKGSKRGKLNWGDCFAYSLAKQRNCPLLFVGDDFRVTDCKLAL